MKMIININQMLKYHLIVSNKGKQNLGTFNHYLNLGSHQSPYSLPFIQAFSIITLNPKQKLPAIANNQHSTFSTLAIPLKGKIKIDSEVYSEHNYQKQILAYNPRNIGTVDNDIGSSTFAYIAIKGEQIKKLPVELKRFSENTTLQIQRSLVFVIDGKITYHQQQILVQIKNKYNFEDLPLLFYARKKLSLSIHKDTLVLIIKERL